MLKRRQPEEATSHHMSMRPKNGRVGGRAVNRTGFDVIVIGAGAAGLSAAKELSQRGFRVTILEARERLGGRILTVRDSPFGAPVELGAEFVHGEPAETFEIVRAAGLNLSWLPDNHHRSKNGKLSASQGFWGKLAELRKDIARATSRTSKDQSLAEYLEHKKLNAESRLLLLNYAEGYNAGHSTKISLKSMAFEEGEDTKQFRIVDGYDRVIDWLAAGFDPARTEMRLNTVATEVHWKTGEVAVQTKRRELSSTESFRGQAVIVTVPAALLRARHVLFEPDIAEKYRSLEKLEPGQVCKVVLKFSEAFWRNDDFLKEHALKNDRLSDGLNFIHSEQDDVPFWWTSLPIENNVLVAWAGGPKGEALLAEDEATRIGRVLAALSKTFGVSQVSANQLLESWSCHDWLHDPFSGAAYTYVGVGGLSVAKSLARPVKKTLFFAGEATDFDQMGTVAGALRSGKRAAQQVLSSLS
jgi:monoamine oxidase